MTAARRQWRNGAWQPAVSPPVVVADRPLAVAPAIPAVAYAGQLDAVAAYLDTMPHTCAGFVFDHPADHTEWSDTLTCHRCGLLNILEGEPKP